MRRKGLEMHSRAAGSCELGRCTARDGLTRNCGDLRYEVNSSTRLWLGESVPSERKDDEVQTAMCTTLVSAEYEKLF